MLGHQNVTERQLAKIMGKADLENYGYLTYGQFRREVAKMKQSKLIVNEEETLEAFVAMGGEPDGEGWVESGTLISVLKTQFEMTIDIEKLLLIIDPKSTGKIGYDDFRMLLAQATGGGGPGH